MHHRLSARHIVCCLLLLICSTSSTSARAAPVINDIYVVLMVVDGARPDIMNDLLASGEMPTLQRAFVESGTTYSHAITIFPSATMPAYQSMVTGRFPGHAGTPYLEWYDRRTGILHAYLRPFAGAPLFNADITSPTLFEDLAGHPTASIYSPVMRGATLQGPTLPIRAALATFVTGRRMKIDRYAFEQLFEIFARPVAQLPRLTMAAFFGTDIIGHKKGPLHATVRKNLRQFDVYLATFLAQLRKRALLDRTYIIITSDHGMHPTTRVFDLHELMEAQGLKTQRSHHDDTAPLYIGARGVSAAIMTVRHPIRGWTYPVDVATLRAYPHDSGTRDLVRIIDEAPETALVLVRDGHTRTRVVAEGREGTITRHRRGRRFTYSYRAPRDGPLQLHRHPHLRRYLHGRPLSASRWNRLLAATDTPGAIPQFGQIFADGRAGDMIVVTHPTWGFFRKKKGTHGTHFAIDMRIPLFVRGPTVPVSQRRVAQTVDLYPTIRRWFGLPRATHPIDGTALFE
jgi:hypothetical protein